jgi:hypothetical protein
MPNIREEIESRGDANLRRKRQQKLYRKIEAKVRQKVEAEQRAKQAPRPRNPLYMPKFLILLVCVNSILLGIALSQYWAAAGEVNAVLYGFLVPLAVIPTVLLVLYIRYLWVFLLYHIYWWITAIIGLFITFGLVVVIVMSLLGNYSVHETVNRTFDQVTQQLGQPTQTP